MPLLVRLNETVALILIEAVHNHRIRRIFLESPEGSFEDRFHPIYKTEIVNCLQLMNNSDVSAMERELPNIWEKIPMMEQQNDQFLESIMEI